MICQSCGQPIKGTIMKLQDGRKFTRYGIVDHIIELTDENVHDTDVSLNNSNLELLCLECHNSKTFGNKYVKNGVFQFDKRNEVNIPDFD